MTESAAGMAAREYQRLYEPRPEAVALWLDLAHCLVEAIDTGRPVPCVVDPDPFTSDDHDDRQEAAAACSVCPALVECGRFALANRESAWVWAGVDLSPRRGVPPGKARAALAELVDDGPEPEVEVEPPPRQRAEPVRREATHTPDPGLVDFFAARAGKMQPAASGVESKHSRLLSPHRLSRDTSRDNAVQSRDPSVNRPVVTDVASRECVTVRRSR